MIRIILLKFTYFIVIGTSVLALSSFGFIGEKSPTIIFRAQGVQEGQIGSADNLAADNPYDNVFHVNVSKELCGSEKVWLVYELDGIEDHSGVARSINDQLAIGGRLVKPRQGWMQQREQIDAAWLRNGDNVIRFTLPECSQHSYRIRNLSIEIQEVESERAVQSLILNSNNRGLKFGNKGYVKGYVPGGKPVNRLIVDGQDVKLIRNQFEAVVVTPASEEHATIEVTAIFDDGTSVCETAQLTDRVEEFYQYERSGVVLSSSSLVSPKTEGKIQVAGASITISKSSLTAPTQISITTLRDVDIPALDQGLVNVTGGHYGFRFLPHGTIFAKNASVRLPFDESKIPDGYTEKDVRTYYFDENTHHWVALSLDTTNHESGIVSSFTTHFTDMINGVLKVPESPEVLGYNSTSIKGIKAANPTARITLIAPPEPNNSGSAAVSYPISIPAGRNDIQPQLSISYNSGGGNGWLGMGWNLALPNISIDTRWGVPRYSTTHETETYTFNGEQLSPVAHRSAFVERVEDRVFHPRVESDFNKIIRHGNNPDNYWWEVTDKEGTRYFYGGNASSNAPDENAILRINNTTGNIAYWALREVRDLNGNTVKYHYVKQEDAGVENGSEPGYQLYISKIDYTGYKGSEGLYTVHFKRDRELGSAMRDDVIISGTLGFKMVTADRLEEIQIFFDKKPVRSYKLKYITGEFSKSLLSSVSEHDAAGEFFNAHTFTYHNDVRPTSSFVPFEEDLKQWSVPSDGVRGGLIVSKTGFNDETSVLSGNKSTDIGFGMTVTVGLNDGKLMNKSNTIGGSFGYSKSETEGKLYMIDINGDGLPDKVIADDNGFRYRPNLSGPDGELKFGDEIAMHNVGGFFKEKSKTTNLGFEAQAGFGDAASAFVGTGTSNTTSVTSLYFTDVNGDQLPDLIKNGLAYFNHLDLSNGEITFSGTSDGTPSEITDGASVAGDIFQVDPNELEAAIDANPLHDVVRMWRAPFTGTITITAPVKLINVNTDAPNADGVIVSIQKNGTQLWKEQIGENDFASHDPGSVSNVSVTAGDRIYFRVQSVENGENDLVEWPAVIEYTDTEKVLTRLDANNKKVYRYSSEEDFVLTAPFEIAAPINGRIKIKSLFQKPLGTDTVTIKVTKNTNGVESVLFDKSYSWDESASDSVNLELDVVENETFAFKIISKTNIDWTALQWKPKLFYVESHDERVPSVMQNGKYMISYNAVCDYSLYANVLKFTESWPYTDNATSIFIKPVMKFLSLPPQNNPFDGDIFISVKKRDTLLMRKTLKIQNGNLVKKDSFEIEVAKDDTLFIEYHVTDELLARGLVEHGANVFVSEQKYYLVSTGLYTVHTQKTDIIYGPLYRQWGGFVYNGNRTRAEAPINESDLKLSSKLEREYESGEVSGPSGLDGAYDPGKELFIMLYARGEDYRWAGHDNLTYLNGNEISSSRMGDDDIEAVQPFEEGSGVTVRGINKISKSTSFSVSAGGGVSGVGSGSANTSNGTSRVVSDFMDLNGDRFPDVVTDQGVQFTLPTGGMEEGYMTFVTGNVQSTTTSSSGASMGGFVKINPKGTMTNARQAKSDVGGAKVSGTISVNYGQGDNTANASWQDINADGLPDKVYANGTVQLNLGYKLGAPEPWLYSTVQKSESESAGGGLGFSIGVGSESSSISGGVGLSRSDNETEKVLQDINGDGLPDELTLESEGVKVRLNTGGGFASAATWYGATKINESSTTGESINIAFTGCFVIPMTPIKICINPSGNTAHSVSRDEARVSDVDGDGFPDYLISENDGHLRARKSLIGRTNLLKSVQRPLGASFNLDYARVGNSYELPNSQWVLAELKVADGVADDGADTLLTTFAYEEPNYNRHEREFFGFGKVIKNTHDTETDNALYTSIVQTFKNGHYYEKGLMVTETLTDAAGNKYTEKENTFVLFDLDGQKHPDNFIESEDGVAFPGLVETIERFYEGESQAGKTSTSTTKYDKYGNITEHFDQNDDADDSDDVTSEIEYHYLDGLHLLNVPKQIVVKGQDGLVRKRVSVVDPNTGDMTQIKSFLSDDEIALHDIEYDQYGNIAKITHPENHAGQRMSLSYLYDDQVYSYVLKASNSYNYFSEATYDLRFGELLSTKDLNANVITYKLDNKGRVSEVKGPYEQHSSAPFTIRFTYYHDADVPWALTEHYDKATPTNFLETVTFVDGLTRVLQTKKDGDLHVGDGQPDEEKMIVSGRQKYDAFGRIVQSWYPLTEELGHQGEFNTNFDGMAPNTTEYDVLGRTVKVTLADGATTTTEYGFDDDRFGKKQFLTRTTDPNGKVTEQFKDMRGLLTSIKNVTADQPVWTSFKYNTIGEQIEATDDLGYTISSQFDLLGRRTSRNHPDAGETKYRYDLAGNMIELETANLREQAASVQYNYHFERVTDVIYPLNPENNIHYTYGEPGATDNRAGRITIQEDASGAQEFFYGPLGDIIKNIRTVVIPGFDEQTYVTEWEYDTWNRLRSLTYPDGEKVEYVYNRGGQLNKMFGKKKTDTYNYVQQLGYDKFEQRVFLAYGNGTKTTYTYQPDRRRLANMRASTAAGRLMIDNSYEYDKVTNILSLKNTAPVPSSNLMGGSSEYSFEYDDLYRLAQAEGTFTGSNHTHEYRLEMQYNSVGSILRKNQFHQRRSNNSDAWVTQKKTTYDFQYGYGETQPHAPVHIGRQTFTYDLNGNQTGWTDDLSGQRRKISWDEENRIMAIADNGAAFHYIYDASGERILKGRGDERSNHVNGKQRAGSTGIGNYTVYPNAFIVLRSGGYTKHYYIENQRIVSKLGSGFDNHGHGPLKAGGDKVNYTAKRQVLTDAIVKNLKFLGENGEILTAGKSGKVPPGQIKGPGYGVPETFQYFYHPDHIGNTGYITDAAGEVYQHLEYFAFGETFVEEHSNTNRTPYLFNGKELDEQTGLYYYGARYYDPRTSVWESVDPMAEEIEQIAKSPYAYVWNNPIQYNDPDGKCPNCATAAAGALIGGLIGGGLELGMQLYRGEDVNWKKVGGSALQGAITGGAAGFTGGASLVVTAGASAGANVVGGALNKTINGEKITAGSVLTDAAIGAGFGVAGTLAGRGAKIGLDKLSNSAKGKLGETLTKVKYAAKGYTSNGKAVVETGRRTATGRTQRAFYDHEMENVFTGRILTVESKFNTAGLTPNQVRAASRVTTPGGLIVDRTTSDQLGRGVKMVVTGSAGQVKTND